MMFQNYALACYTFKHARIGIIGANKSGLNIFQAHSIQFKTQSFMEPNSSEFWGTVVDQVVYSWKI